MTRTYAARKLLEHGPLTFGEMRAITLWTAPQVSSALQNLEKMGVLVATGKAWRRVYGIEP